MNIIESVIEINAKKIPIISNDIESKKILIFIHGLDGTALEFKQLAKYFTNFQFLAMKQRGHENEVNLPASRFYKNYINDIYDLVRFYKSKNKKVYILGGSMGASFSSLISYFYKEKIEAIFACAVPNKLINLFLDKTSKKWIINFRTTLTFLFNINYSFRAKINFPMLTNNKLYIRLGSLKSTRNSQTRNIISTWKSNRIFWKKITRKKPNSKIYFFYGKEDVVINQKKAFKKLENAQKKFSNFKFFLLPNSKHLILNEADKEIIFDKINEVILVKNNN